MIKTLLGTKKEMSSAFDRLGHRIPVTLIVAESNVVVGARAQKVILGFGQKKRAKKTDNAYVKAVGYMPRFIKEASITSSQTQPANINPKDKVSVSIFEVGDLVKVTGTTRGRGFAGVVKRWGFAGGPKTHGQSDRHRAPGSIGAGTTPGRVWKGKKMAGHMGASKLTITNLEVVEVNPDKNIITVKGSVPGTKNGLVIIEKTGKAKIPKIPETPKPKEETATAEDIEKKAESTKEKPATSENTENKTGSTDSKSVTSMEAEKGEQNAD